MDKIKIIQKMVCDVFEISELDLISRNKNAKYIPARHISMWLVRELTHESYPVIAREFAGRHHTSIMHGERNAKVLFSRDVHYQDLANLVAARYKQAYP